jgi:transcriptional antiterminator RfaH
MSKPWFLVRTKPQQESYAAENCKGQGFKPFLPKFFCEERQRLVPLFPSYLFVQTDGRWYILESTWGIIKVIRWSDTPDKIPNKVIAALRKRADRKGIVKVQRKVYQPGQELLVKRGPFAELTAIFQETTDQGRVSALLSIFGRSTSVEFEARDVQAVAA